MLNIEIYNRENQFGVEYREYRNNNNKKIFF